MCRVAMNIFILSFGFWLFYGLCCIFAIKRFIVDRYEKETDLLNTVYFREHFTFASHAPGFYSSGFYATHLISCVWAWRIYRNRKIFRDIGNPEQVTKHFSRKEIWKVKRVMIVGGIVMVHLITFIVIEMV